MKRWFILFLLPLVVFGGVVYTNLKNDSEPQIAVSEIEDVEEEAQPPNFSTFAAVSDYNIEGLTHYTNVERAKAGLHNLQIDDRLNLSALMKCNDMVEKEYFAHDAPDGSSPWVFFKRVGIRSYKLLGENLLERADKLNSQQAVNHWMASPAHKENLLKPAFTHVGFGICGGGSSYDPVTKVGSIKLVKVVQHFAAFK